MVRFFLAVWTDKCHSQGILDDKHTAPRAIDIWLQQ